MRTVRPCDMCGLVGRWRKKKNGMRYCIACGIARAVQAAAQLRAKAGPFYDAWLVSAGPRGRGASRNRGSST